MNILGSIDRLLFERILPKIIYYYDRHIFYRLRKAYGIAVLRGIKHKGENIKIHGNCTIIGKDKIEIGNDVRIGNNCYLNALGGISIGNNTQISRNVTIYSCNHNYNGSAIPYDNTYILKPVRIGESVWIGMNAMILPGVNIGKGAIIGMGAVVTKDIPEFSIVVGFSGKIIKQRDVVSFSDLEKRGLFFGSMYPND